MTRGKQSQLEATNLEGRYVELEITDGPYIVLSNDGNGVDAEHEFVNGIVAHEYYPSVARGESTNYVLSLRKPVQTENEVSQADTDLHIALQSLAEAWPFSGGNRLQLSRKTVQEKPTTTSNADQVRDQFAADRGARRMSAQISSNSCVCGTWHDFPLGRAIEICTLAARDCSLAKSLSYYCEADPDSNYWYSELYKVRDTLKKEFKSEKKCKHALRITSSEWKYFGQDINALRHPSDVVISPRRQAELLAIARCWIVYYIDHLETKVKVT